MARFSLEEYECYPENPTLASTFPHHRQTTIKIYMDTRRKLKLLAALLDKSMVDVLEQLVSEALKKAQTDVAQESL